MRMRRLPLLALMLLVRTLVPACRGVGQDMEDRLTVEIDSVDVLQLESYPVQLVLRVEGWLPHACASPAWDVRARSAESPLPCRRPAW